MDYYSASRALLQSTHDPTYDLLHASDEIQLNDAPAMTTSVEPPVWSQWLILYRLHQISAPRLRRTLILQVLVVLNERTTVIIIIINQTFIMRLLLSKIRT